MLAARLSKPRCVSPPSGSSAMYVAPKPMPRFSVMRFDTSTAKPVSRVAGSSPLAGILRLSIVGSDNSSATNGSSVASVAGKKRLPARPCAAAGSADRTTIAAATSVSGVAIDRLFFVFMITALSLAACRRCGRRECSVQRTVWGCIAPPAMLSTSTLTSIDPAFSNPSVSGKVSPACSGRLRSVSIT